MLLLTNFKIRSKKLFNVLLGNFGPPTVGLSFKYLNSEMVISSLFSSLIALCKISDFFILRQPWKLLVSKELWLKYLYSEYVSNGLYFVIKAFVFFSYYLGGIWI